MEWSVVEKVNFGSRFGEEVAPTAWVVIPGSAMHPLDFDKEMLKVLENLNASLPPAARLHGLAVERRLAGLSAEQVAELKELLDRPIEANRSSP